MHQLPRRPQLCRPGTGSGKSGHSRGGGPCGVGWQAMPCCHADLVSVVCVAATRYPRFPVVAANADAAVCPWPQDPCPGGAYAGPGSTSCTPCPAGSRYIIGDPLLPPLLSQHTCAMHARANNKTHISRSIRRNVAATRAVTVSTAPALIWPPRALPDFFYLTWQLSATIVDTRPLRDRHVRSGRGIGL